MMEHHEPYNLDVQPEIKASNMRGKPLGQSLGSKMEKKFKTEAEN